MARRNPGVYRAKNGSWFFRAWYLDDSLTDGRWKQTTRRGFATASDAASARRVFLQDQETKKHDERSLAGSSTTVHELVAKYLDESESLRRLGAKTLFDYRSYQASYIDPHLGHIDAGELTPEMVADWQVLLATKGAVKSGGPLAPGTIRLARAPMNGAYKYGIVNGLVTSNPVPEVSPPPRQRSKPAHWSPDEARQFLALHEGDRLLPLWSFLLGSGLRIGELVWLRWSQVDLAGMRVRINTFATTLGYAVVESDGKSVDATRTVDLDDHLVQVLVEQRRIQEADRLAVGDNYVESGYVFTRPAGGDHHPQNLSKLLGTLSTAADLPRLTAHGLRHTCATLMLAEGVAPKVAAERLGHADPTLFMNLYSHVTPTMQREAAAKLGEALFGS